MELLNREHLLAWQADGKIIGKLGGINKNKFQWRHVKVEGNMLKYHEVGTTKTHWIELGGSTRVKIQNPAHFMKFKFQGKHPHKLPPFVKPVFISVFNPSSPGAKPFVFQVPEEDLYKWVGLFDVEGTPLTKAPSRPAIVPVVDTSKITPADSSIMTPPSSPSGSKSESRHSGKTNHESRAAKQGGDKHKETMKDDQNDKTPRRKSKPRNLAPSLTGKKKSSKEERELISPRAVVEFPETRHIIEIKKDETLKQVEDVSHVEEKPKPSSIRAFTKSWERGMSQTSTHKKGALDLAKKPVKSKSNEKLETPNTIREEDGESQKISLRPNFNSYDEVDELAMLQNAEPYLDSDDNGDSDSTESDHHFDSTEVEDHHFDSTETEDHRFKKAPTQNNLLDSAGSDHHFDSTETEDHRFQDSTEISDHHFDSSELSQPHFDGEVSEHHFDSTEADDLSTTRNPEIWRPFSLPLPRAPSHHQEEAIGLRQDDLIPQQADSGEESQNTDQAPIEFNFESLNLGLSGLIAGSEHDSTNSHTDFSSSSVEVPPEYFERLTLG